MSGRTRENDPPCTVSISGVSIRTAIVALFIAEIKSAFNGDVALLFLGGECHHKEMTQATVFYVG